MMNYQIIKTELQKMSDFLTTSIKDNLSIKSCFEPNFFNGDYNYFPKKSFQITPASQDKDVSKVDSETLINKKENARKEIKALNRKLRYSKQFIIFIAFFDIKRSSFIIRTNFFLNYFDDIILATTNSKNSYRGPINI